MEGGGESREWSFHAHYDRGELSCWAEHRYDQFFFLSRFLPLPFDRICYLYIYIYICMGIWLQDFFIEENLWEKEKRNSGCEKSLIINLSLDLFFFFLFPYIYLYNQRFENEKWSSGRKTFIFTSSFFKAGNRGFFFFFFFFLKKCAWK